MATSQIKRRGQRKAVVSTKLADDILSEVDSYARGTDSTRSAAIAQLIQLGLNSPEHANRLVAEVNDLRQRIKSAKDVLR